MVLRFLARELLASVLRFLHHGFLRQYSHAALRKTWALKDMDAANAARRVQWPAEQNEN